MYTEKPEIETLFLPDRKQFMPVLHFRPVNAVCANYRCFFLKRIQKS